VQFFEKVSHGKEEARLIEQDLRNPSSHS